MKQIVLGCALAALMGSHALASDLGASNTSRQPGSAATGLFVGIGGGLDVQNLSEKGSPVTIGDDSYVVRARAGYDFAPLTVAGMPSLVFSVIGDISYSTAETLDVKAAWSADLLARVGVPLGGSLLYAGGGGVWKEFDVPAVSYNPSGWAVIAGLQTDLGRNWALQIEGRREWADDKVEGIKINNTADSVSLFLIKKF